MISDDTSKEFENKIGHKYGHIKGWGIDMDPKNDPTYPMKKRKDLEILGYTWERPPLQPVKIEVLHSIERPNITAVFGTAMPPKGLSGMIRRAAFKKSESSYGRWLPLILADRIGVVEGYIEDFSKGIVPNPFAERGWQSEMKYNKKNFILKAAVTTAVVAGVAAFLLSRKEKEEIKEIH